jgi:hypothetical protein
MEEDTLELKRALINMALLSKEQLDRVAIEQDKDKNNDFQNKRLRNVSDPVDLYDAINLKHLQTNRINVMH